MERNRRGKRYRLVASFPFVSSLFLATNSPFILFPLSSIPFSSSRVFPCRRFLRQIMDTGERNGISFPHQQTHSPASCIRWPLHPILTIHFIHAFHSLSLQHGKVIEKKGKREDINNKQMKGEELTILTTIIICWRDKFTSPQLNSKSYHSPHPSFFIIHLPCLSFSQFLQSKMGRGT